VRIRSYYATSVEEALNRASSEMGSDAVLVHSRKSPAETGHLGPYEVVFALPKRPGEPERRLAAGPFTAEPPREESPVAAAPAFGTDLQVSLELMQMRRQMDEIRRALELRQPACPSESGSVQERLAPVLAAKGIDQELAREIAAAAATKAPAGANLAASQSNLDLALRAEVINRLAPLPDAEDPPVVALVGPPGSGKTTTAIKIAARLSHVSGRPVHLAGRYSSPFSRRCSGATTARPPSCPVKSPMWRSICCMGSCG